MTTATAQDILYKDHSFSELCDIMGYNEQQVKWFSEKIGQEATCVILKRTAYDTLLSANKIPTGLYFNLRTKQVVGENKNGDMGFLGPGTFIYKNKKWRVFK